MHSPELNYAKGEVFRNIAVSIFKRGAMADNLYAASIGFLRRRHPELWHDPEGEAFLKALRAAHDKPENWTDSDSMRAALKEVATSSGFTADYLDNFAFRAS